MLKKRVVTASIMMLVFLGVLFLCPPIVFILFAALVFLVGAWEWARLSGLNGNLQTLSYVFFTGLLACAIGFWTEWSTDHDRLQLLFTFAALWWGIALLWIQGYPSSAVLWRSVYVRALMGLLILVPAWFSVMYLRSMAKGEWIVLLALLIVAAADVGAYFSGRQFGRNKLAPDVSPGKSWEGVAGGMVLATIVAAVFVTFLSGALPPIKYLIVVMLVALISVVGDLLESMVKRACGVKDSSNLLPGHGGVLDRVDGLVAALPIISLSYLLTQWQW